MRSLGRFCCCSCLFREEAPSGQASSLQGLESTPPKQRISVFPRLKVRSERREASSNLLTMSWRSDSLCTIKAQSSVKSASRIISSNVLVLVSRRCRSKSDPSSWYLKNVGLHSLDKVPDWLVEKICEQRFFFFNKKIKKDFGQHESLLHVFSDFRWVRRFAFLRTRLIISSWKSWIVLTNVLRQPNCGKMVQRATLLTISKGLGKVS